mmetsp:Transcript_36473/g.69975  ORF Transcript_36473/g.69975 Transcript_36473/m.69975 type:complete len:208 (+) Transcript_36473:9277-9900(+)
MSPPFVACWYLSVPYPLQPMRPIVCWFPPHPDLASILQPHPKWHLRLSSWPAPNLQRTTKWRRTSPQHPLRPSASQSRESQVQRPWRRAPHACLYVSYLESWHQVVLHLQAARLEANYHLLVSSCCELKIPQHKMCRIFSRKHMLHIPTVCLPHGPGRRCVHCVPTAKEVQPHMMSTIQPPAVLENPCLPISHTTLQPVGSGKCSPH